MAETRYETNCTPPKRLSDIAPNGIMTPESAKLFQSPQKILTSQIAVHVEICLKEQCVASDEAILTHVKQLISEMEYLSNDMTLTNFENQCLHDNLEFINICWRSCLKKAVAFHEADISYHLYSLNIDGLSSEELPGSDHGGIIGAYHRLLPARELTGVWESLYFDDDVKDQLLDYILTTLFFAEKKIDSNVITWNKVILLHGPPGTGKTSLCKGLAQKVSIRLSDKYKIGQLVEINTHSLFSKYFSESGKLVLKMFKLIQDLSDDPNCLVFVLIDEVESLAAARKASFDRSEPSDAVRVVNALLTQIDQLKRFPNVVVLTTSNISDVIDVAFVDRADIKQFIDFPSAKAIYQIYFSCVNELLQKGLIDTKQYILDLASISGMRATSEPELKERDQEAARLSLKLMKIAEKSHGLSGRVLRKMPFLAVARFLQRSIPSLDVFLDCLMKTVIIHFHDDDKIGKC